MKKKKSYTIKIKADSNTDEVISIKQTGCPWNCMDAKKHMTNVFKDALKALE